MVEAARQQLRQPEGVARLVLEYAETIDFRHQSRSAAHVAQLQRAGVRVMLDDCFSQGSVIFPARRQHFNAYKLDMSIVNDAQHDPKALALIKSLAYYCQLSGSRCVAEGVDSLAKFTQLKSLGIDRFQGYLFSPPMRREHLPDLIRRFPTSAIRRNVEGARKAHRLAPVPVRHARISSYSRVLSNSCLANGQRGIIFRCSWRIFPLPSPPAVSPRPGLSGWDQHRYVR